MKSDKNQFSKQNTEEQNTIIRVNSDALLVYIKVKHNRWETNKCKEIASYVFFNRFHEK